MRAADLFETTLGELYHGTSFTALIHVIDQNKIGFTKEEWVSLTRSKVIATRFASGRTFETVADMDNMLELDEAEPRRLLPVQYAEWSAYRNTGTGWVGFATKPIASGAVIVINRRMLASKTKIYAYDDGGGSQATNRKLMKAQQDWRERQHKWEFEERIHPVSNFNSCIDRVHLQNRVLWENFCVCLRELYDGQNPYEAAISFVNAKSGNL